MPAEKTENLHRKLNVQSARLAGILWLGRMFQNRTRHGSSECRHTVLREIHSLFQHAFNLGDVEALIALEPNAVLVADGQDVIGRESIRKALQDLLPRVVG